MSPSSNPSSGSNQVRIIYPPRMVMDIPSASFDDLDLELDRVAKTMQYQDLDHSSQGEMPQHPTSPSSPTLTQESTRNHDSFTSDPIPPSSSSPPLPPRPSSPSDPISPTESYCGKRGEEVAALEQKSKSSTSFGWLRAGRKLGSVRERMSRRLVLKKGGKPVEVSSPSLIKASISNPLELTPPGSPTTPQTPEKSSLPRGVLHDFRPVSTCTTDTKLTSMEESLPFKAPEGGLTGPRENPFRSSPSSSSPSSRTPSMRGAILHAPHPPSSTTSEPIPPKVPSPPSPPGRPDTVPSPKSLKPLPDPSSLPIPRSPQRSNSQPSRSGMADPNRNTMFDRELNASRTRAAYAHAMDFDDDEEEEEAKEGHEVRARKSN
ncbi:MAG: hypothetical protein DHS80DRAFT_31277 [Piptocephalis tieghemiana]|nr:MAG: hypothetical protein DHS80DRAFT_31277 [Piptocephalis tieghemiana]